jgi:hypothetical protein
MTKTPTLKTQTYRVDRSHYSDTLDQIHTKAQQIEELTDALGYFVRGARKEGATWADIGRELGVTRSAAQQRFGG